MSPPLVAVLKEVIAFCLSLTPMPGVIGPPLRVTLHSEYTVPTYFFRLTCFPVLFSHWRVGISHFTFWGNCFSLPFFSLYPGAALSITYFFPPSCTVDHGPDRYPRFVVIGGLLWGWGPIG